MRALVAGGAGFLGSHLVDRLDYEGYEVTVVDNMLTGSARNLERKVHVRDVSTDHLADFGRHDVVYHLASPASPAVYQKWALATLRAGSDATFNLLELAKEWGARFVLASTSEVYGDPLESPQRETYRGNVDPAGPRSMYDEAKRFAEAVTAEYGRQGVDVRVARIFNTYGPRMGANDGRVIPSFIRAALRGEPMVVHGDGLQTRSFCYVDDLIEGLLRLAEVNLVAPVGAVNLGNPAEETIRGLSYRITTIAKGPGLFHYTDRPADDPSQRRPDVTKARQLLGWRARVELNDGLKRTIDWCRGGEAW